MKIGFIVRQLAKMAAQSVVLPIVYRLFCRKNVKKDLVLFADAHHNQMPYSMQYMYDRVQAMGLTAEVHVMDFNKASFGRLIKAMVRFMKSYAQAGCVFICDYYLPAGACKRRPQTKLVQLWHACGAFKKFGFDAGEDIPAFYKGNPMKNCTLVTVSSECCEPIYAKALKVPPHAVQAFGVSRTDRYFSEAYNEDCLKRFYEAYPNAKGKKIVLWAPTFRGNARHPQLEGLRAVESLKKQLGDEWFVIVKLHPHLEGRAGRSNCTMLTEELLPAADVLVTDYSSILFDYMVYGKPIVLFAPDGRDYRDARGFYLNYKEIPARHVFKAADLAEAVRESFSSTVNYGTFYEKYMGACDGKATERILEFLFKKEEKPNE